MGTINNIFSSSAIEPNKPLAESGFKIKFTFEPSEIGAARQKNGQFPPTKLISESAAKTALFKHFGFNPNNPADYARVKELLQTAGNPFSIVETSGQMLAEYNVNSGKYELVFNVEKDLYQKLQGTAADVKRQIETEKQLLKNPANLNDAFAGKNGISNADYLKNELNKKLDARQNNGDSMSAVNDSKQTVKTLTDSIAKITATEDGLSQNQIGAQFNRLGVSTLHLTGRAMEMTNTFDEKIHDAIRYVAPDSIGENLAQAEKTNRQIADALQNANSALTQDDTFADKRAAQLGKEIPAAEDLANKAMYFPEGIPNAIDSAIKGDFKDDDGTYSDRVGKIVGGLNPIGDVRDIIADGKRVHEGEKGSLIKLGGTLLGAIPIAGDVGKVLVKSEEKAIIKTLENGVEKEVEKEVVKVGEETTEKVVAKESEDLVKAEAEQIAKRYDEIAKDGHGVQRHGEAVTEQQLDERAMYGKDPITGTTDDAYNKFPDGTPKPHQTGKNATKFTSKESLVKAETYARNTQNYKDAVALAEADGSDYITVKDIKLETIYGADYKNQVFGKTRLGSKNHPTGTAVTDFTDGTLTAKFKKDVFGNWKLDTMFPEPK